MPWRNTPENFFSAVGGCPQSCARTNPWFRGRILGGKCAQEPPPGSAVKHCRFLGTGGGGKFQCPPPPGKKNHGPPCQWPPFRERTILARAIGRVGDGIWNLSSFRSRLLRSGFPFGMAIQHCLLQVWCQL